jgi:transposase InsO family protein
MSDHDQPIAANVLNREFEADAPNQRWVGDTTELLTPSGVFYLAAIVDLYARLVVGWAVSAVNDRHLTIAALEQALRRRCPDEGLLHHSDRGSTYTSEDYRRILEQHGIVCSMSRTGNCYDNAVVESFWGKLKTEMVYHQHFATKAQARAAVFEYIEMFYNRKRLHAALDYLSPEAFEGRKVG